MELTRAANLPRLPVLGWRNVSLSRQQPPIVRCAAERTMVLTTSGRAAILMALEALAIGPGDRVLVPTYHCPTMIAPIVRLGAEPIFYPITSQASADERWLATIDPSGIKAMIAVHLFGLPRPMKSLRDFCRARGIALIEDCAHAFFGALDAVPVGSTGDFAITSMPKFFPVTEGGGLLGPASMLGRMGLEQPSLATEVRGVIDAIEVGASFGRFGVVGVGVNVLVGMKRRLRSARPSTAAAADGAADDPATWLDDGLIRRAPTAMTRWTFEHTDLARLAARRRANYLAWSSAMRGMARARPVFPDLPAEAVPYVFPLLVDDPERAYYELRAEGVPIFRWDVAWSNVPHLAGDEGRGWLTTVFQLGCHQDLTENDVERLAHTVRRVLGAA